MEKSTETELNNPPIAKGGWPIGSALKFAEDRLGFFFRICA